ncbi:MAG: SDR family oxidoreductase [Rhizobiales bacterium]|nr:SDR family oxidoreductase [Hyphomicrobiales bacterium]
MDLNLKGRTALITGGSRGIGESVAKVLAAEGCDLTLAATDSAKLKSVADEIIAAHGVKVVTHSLDLSKHDSIKHLADVAGDCDILVNNAGAIPRGSLYDVTPEAWRRGWDLKVFGYIDLTRYILPRMTARKSGVIVNVVGMAGERPEPNYIATSCGNAALMMFTQCLGGESVRDGVRIVAVNPGPIMSDRHRKGAERVAERELGSRDRWPELYKRFPIGRPGRVEEVAYMVAFLASDLASYISGETIRIDAGLKVRDPVY